MLNRVCLSSSSAGMHEVVLCVLVETKFNSD